MAETLQDTLDQREKAHEAKYKLDQEQRFKARSRRNRLLGLWAAERMGLGGAGGEAYAREVVVAEMEGPGEGRVAAKVAGDLAERGVVVSEQEIAGQMERLHALAIEQIAEEYPKPLGDDYSPVGG